MSARDAGTRHVVVVGLMGVGKTTVGRALADWLGWRLDDSDAEISAATGQTVRELADTIGVAEMHRLEGEHLLDGLAKADPSVICAAASVIDEPSCRAALRAPDVLSIWLRGSPMTLAARFDDQPHRPRFGRDHVALLHDQAAGREQRYAASSSLVVEVDGVTQAAVILTVIDLVAGRGIVSSTHGRHLQGDSDATA